MTLETLVGAFILAIVSLPTGETAFTPVSGPVLMPLVECMEQSKAINYDKENPYIMICLPQADDASAVTE